MVTGTHILTVHNPDGSDVPTTILDGQQASQLDQLVQGQRGPAGPQGATGAQGPQGPAGPQRCGWKIFNRY